MLSKQKQRETLFGVLSGCALGVLFSFYTFQIYHGAARESPYSHSPKERRTSDNGQQAESTTWYWLTHDEAGFFTFWLVVVALGQAGLFFWQLKLIGAGLTDLRRRLRLPSCPLKLPTNRLDFLARQLKHNSELTYGSEPQR